MARTSTPAPHAARSAADAATTPDPAPVAPAASDSPAVAVLAALSADPGSAADASEPDPVTAEASAGDQQADVGPEPGPDPAVTAEATGSALAIAQAADEAGKALAAGNPDVVLAALDTVRDLPAQGRRVLKAVVSGRRAAATRPGALRDLVEDHLRKFPAAAFTPHQVGKVLTGSTGAVANALDKLVSLGVAQMVTDKPRTYWLAPAPDAAGDPGTSAEAAPSAA
jgi:hypothetical protein